MTTKKVSTAALITGASVLFGAASLAQQPQPNDAVFIARGTGPVPFGGAVDIIAGAGSVIGAVVVDKPYSADSITESTQMLVDGNRITSTNRTRIYRDAQGRTRREHILDSLGVWQTAGEPVSMVMINDPVKDVSYFLDPRAQTAREIKPFHLETMPLPPGGPAPGDENIVVEWRSAESVVGQAGVAAPAIGQFEIPLPPPGAMPILTSAPTVAFGAIASFAGAAATEATTEDLGEQILEGVLTRGTRQVQTIAAGAIGNELPIEIVQEQWYSADLEAIVLRRNFDPRFGETTYRLINVDRSEPSPELFSIPQAYELQSEPGPAFGARRLGPGPGPGFVPGTAGQRVERRVFLVRPDPARTDSPNAAGE